MGNRQSREFARQQDEIARQEKDLAEWERLRTLMWTIDSEIDIRGIGTRRCQLAIKPSFRDGVVWDLRQVQTEWRLYSSSIPGEQMSFAIGYEAVPIAFRVLGTYFERVTCLRLPIAPDLRGCGGADGTISWLSIIGDGYSQVRFQWWTDYPPNWEPLIEVAREMATAFSSASGQPNPYDDD